MEESKYQELSQGEMLIKAISGGADYEKVPAGEPLKAHIDNIRVVDTNKYQSEERTKKLAIGFKLDESDGKDQVYSKWFTPSLNEKGNLIKLIKALYPEQVVDAIDPTELVGLPVRVVLSEPDRESGRQWIDSFLKAASDQKKVVKDVVPTDDQLSDDEIAKAFAGELDTDSD